MRSAEMIGWAVGGLEREILATRERLVTLTAQANALRSKLPGGSAGRGRAAASGASEPTGTEEAAGTGKRRRRRRRTMSPEARKRISDMMKKRWAERRKAAK